MRKHSKKGRKEVVEDGGRDGRKEEEVQVRNVKRKKVVEKEGRD